MEQTIFLQTQAEFQAMLNLLTAGNYTVVGVEMLKGGIFRITFDSPFSLP